MLTTSTNIHIRYLHCKYHYDTTLTFLRSHPQSEILTFTTLYHISDNIRLLRLLRSCRKLLFDSQQIIDGVQNRILPLDVIPQPEDVLSRACVEYSVR